MQEFLTSTPAQAVIWTAVLVVLMVVGAWVVRRFRDRADDHQLSANELLTNFRELHHQGDINESEFRTIKTVLGPQIQDESKDREEKG